VSAEFVALADLLRAAAAPAAPPDTAGSVAGEARIDASEAQPVAAHANENAFFGTPDERDDRVASIGEEDVVAGALRDARLFRARLADAFDDAVARLVRELAADVLARELRLAPCEIAALVRRVLQRAPVIRVRVAPADVGFVRGVPVLADPALAVGDAIIELGRGELDARLGVRLAAVLEAFT
jgi:hypothetical protein